MQFTFGYSRKNSPICSEKQYIKALIDKVDKSVKNVQWRSFFFLNHDIKNLRKKPIASSQQNHPTFSISELKDFEEGLLSLIESIKFREMNNNVQKVLRNGMKRIQKNKVLLVPADKTTNCSHSAASSMQI